MDTYNKPPHGWTCFHCGETFTTVGAARDHFGFSPSSDPACRIKAGSERGLLMALRKAEALLAHDCENNTQEVADVLQRMRAMQHRHANALRDAEELGYERGLADGRKLCQPAA